MSSGLCQQGDRAPDQQDPTDNHEEHHSAWSIDGVVNGIWALPLSMFPPCHPVAHEKRQAEGNDEFREKIVEVEELTHSVHANAR